MDFYAESCQALAYNAEYVENTCSDPESKRTGKCQQWECCAAKCSTSGIEEDACPSHLKAVKDLGPEHDVLCEGFYGCTTDQCCYAEVNATDSCIDAGWDGRVEAVGTLECPDGQQGREEDDGYTSWNGVMTATDCCGQTCAAWVEGGNECPANMTTNDKHGVCMGGDCDQQQCCYMTCGDSFEGTCSGDLVPVAKSEWCGNSEHSECQKESKCCREPEPCDEACKDYDLNTSGDDPWCVDNSCDGRWDIYYLEKPVFSDEFFS